MRRTAVALSGLALVGCGATEQAAQRPLAHVQVGHRVAVPPAQRHGFWVKLFLSPNQKWWLGQWSGECEAQSTYFIPARGGKPISVFRPSDESQALGWAHGRARVLAPRGLCGGTHGAPGVYLVDPKTRDATLVRRVNALPGGP